MREVERKLSFFEKYLTLLVFLCIFTGILIGKTVPYNFKLVMALTFVHTVKCCHQYLNLLFSSNHLHFIIFFSWLFVLIKIRIDFYSGKSNVL